MSRQKKDQRVALMMSAEELKKLDDWMFSQRIRSRAEAIRRLISKEVDPDLAADEVLAKSATSVKRRR